MSIDNGMSRFEQCIQAGYIKSTSQGCTITQKGFNWICDYLQEFDNEIKHIKQNLDLLYNNTAQFNVNRSNKNRDSAI